MAKSRLPKLNYFYYNGQLHRKIHIDIPNDVVTAFNYEENKVKKYVYTAVRRNGRKAFTTRQVAKLLNRELSYMRNLLEQGVLRPPPRTYRQGGRVKPGPGAYIYLWSEDHIMEAYDHFANTHFGRPRKDGLVTPLGLPSRRELRAMIRQDTVLYAKVGDEDKFVPVWDAK